MSTNIKNNIGTQYFKPQWDGDIININHPDISFGSTDYTDKYYVHYQTGELTYPCCEFHIYERRMKYINIEDPQWILITGSFEWEVYGFDNVIMINRFIKSLYVSEKVK